MSEQYCLKKRQNKKDNEMIVKDVCMHTVVCTVQGSLFVQL